MSLTTYVVGFRPPNDQWRKMKAVFDACEAAGTPVPAAVVSFFEGGRPDPKGVEVPLGLAVKPWGSNDASGYEVDVTLLPKGVVLLRFANSW